MLGNILDIPVSLVGKVPCQDPETRGLFHTLDLDIDLDDPDYIALSPEGKQARHAAKQVAEVAAVEACQMCPMMTACREWALEATVHGVAGGLTEAQRARREFGAVATLPTDEDLARGARNTIPDEWVHSWTDEGASAGMIATRLDCSVRTVERARQRRTAPTAHSLARHTPVNPQIRVRLARGTKPEPAGAKTALDFTTLTPESLALYEFLAAHPEPVNRKQVIAHVAGFVPDDVARKWGENLPCGADKKAQQGALKFARNRIDIAYRHGRITRSGTGKDTVLSLSHQVRRDYQTWRNSVSAAASA